MQILTTFSKDRLYQLNKINDVFTDFSHPTKDSVALVIEGDRFSSNLSAAIELSVPIIVIAGLKTTGQKYMQEAQEFGVPDRCIIFKDQENIVSADGHRFSQSLKGINIKTITDIASYVLENQLYPEIFIWQEPPQRSKPAQTESQIWQEPKPRQPEKPRVVQEPQKPQKTKKHIVAEELSTFLTKAKVLAVLKSVPTINSASTAKTLAEKLNGIHLEINNNPQSFQQYASSKENALRESYAFSNGKTVEYTAFDFRWIVVEINPAMMDIMSAVYEQAAKTIYAVESFDESEPALDMWIEGGYKLDAIIPDPINMTSYKEKYGDKVYELNRFANQIERG